MASPLRSMRAVRRLRRRNSVFVPQCSLTSNVLERSITENDDSIMICRAILASAQHFAGTNICVRTLTKAIIPGLRTCTYQCTAYMYLQEDFQFSLKVITGLRPPIIPALDPLPVTRYIALRKASSIYVYHKSHLPTNPQGSDQTPSPSQTLPSPYASTKTLPVHSRENTLPIPNARGKRASKFPIPWS